MLGAVVLDSSHFYHISTAFLDKILSIKKEKKNKKKLEILQVQIVF